MKYIVIFTVILFPLNTLMAVEVVPGGRPSEGQREYRQGFTDGVVAGQHRGQGVWSILGCIGGVVGSVGGCYTCGIGASCWYEESCIDLSEENVTWFVAATGCLGGMITGGILYAFAGGSGDTPTLLVGQSPEYTRGYVDGYQHITKKNKKKATLTGTLVGTTLGTLWLVFITYPVYWY